jgi:hypothetical protein
MDQYRDAPTGQPVREAPLQRREHQQRWHDGHSREEHDSLGCADAREIPNRRSDGEYLRLLDEDECPQVIVSEEYQLETVRRTRTRLEEPGQPALPASTAPRRSSAGGSTLPAGCSPHAR